MNRGVCKNELAALIVIISLILPSTGYAAIYYVAIDGNDSNPGTELSPFKTIQRAADIAGPGDTINVGQGVYRETVILQNSGTENSRIVFKTDPRNRAVISGAEVVAEWQLLDVNENIYYADVPDVPESPSWIWNRLFKEDQKALTLARMPKEGWWITEDAGPNILIDTVNLFQYTEANDLIGAECFYSAICGCGDFLRKIVNYSPVTSELVFDNNNIEPAGGKDHYYLRNKLNLLTEAGEWVLDRDREIPRFYVRPSDDGQIGAHLYEYPKRGKLVNLNGKSYVTFEGFEIRDSAFYGIYAEQPADGFRLLNCRLRSNQRMAAVVVGNNIVVRNNVVEENGYGIVVESGENARIEHNHIFNSGYDGLILGYSVSNAQIVDNFIHDQIFWGHPDAVQFHNDVNSAHIERNVLLNNGQSIMLGQTYAGQIVNNLIAGSIGYSVIFGHNSSYPYKVIGNTIALSGYGPIGLTEPNEPNQPLSGVFEFDYEFKNNILCPPHGSIYSFAWQEPNVYTNYNLTYQTNTAASFGRYEDTWADDLQQWQNISGLDANSKEGNPLFVNAPEYYVSSDYSYLCTRSKLYVRDHSEYIDVGDHIETNFDGVDRIVINKGSEPYTDNDGSPITIDYIEIEPLLRRRLDREISVANWKEKQVGELDFRLQRDSPALGMGENDCDVGYEVNLPALRRSDFDGDGIIDDPRYRTLAGDFDGDRDVDLEDFAVFSAYWGQRNAPVSGDLNANRKVNMTDFAILSSQWKQEGCSEPEWCYGSDIDNSGEVDFEDLSVVAENWLEGCGEIAGDLDKDGDLDLADLAVLAGNWLAGAV